METACASSNLISDVSSLADSAIRDLDFDSVNVEAYSQLVEVSVHLGPVEAIVRAEHTPTTDVLVPAPQCALLVVQTTSVAVPLLVPGPSFLPGTRAPITMQGPAFPPICRVPIVFLGAPVAPVAPQIAMQNTGVPQGAAILAMAGVPWLIQATFYTSAFMAPPACLFIFLGPWHSMSLCKPSLNSLLGNAMIWRQERDRGQRNRALNLNALRDARVLAAAPVAGSSHFSKQEKTPLKPRRASSQVTSQTSLTLTRAPFSGIKVTSTVTTKTVKPLPASPQLRVILQETPTQLQSQSSTVDPEPSISRYFRRLEFQL